MERKKDRYNNSFKVAYINVCYNKCKIYFMNACPSTPYRIMHLNLIFKCLGSYISMLLIYYYDLYYYTL